MRGEGSFSNQLERYSIVTHWAVLFFSCSRQPHSLPRRTMPELIGDDSRTDILSGHRWLVLTSAAAIMEKFVSHGASGHTIHVGPNQWGNLRARNPFGPLLIGHLLEWKSRNLAFGMKRLGAIISDRSQVQSSLVLKQYCHIFLVIFVSLNLLLQRWFGLVIDGGLYV